MQSCGLILLAAGSSNRLGQPKQLLVYNGKTLLEHTLQAATGSAFEHIFIVLGSDSDEMVSLIGKSKVQVVQNEDWTEGIASSIRCGLSSLLSKFPSVSAAAFMVCDQPFVSASLLDELLGNRDGKKPVIVACSYENTMGVPALFSSHFFPELIQLKGQEGAKKIIMQHIDIVETIPFPEGNVDIDTMDDYKRLTNRS
ncbi:MAG TPA: nucleotidyltransferase family protein [Puia sp.]|nr:nucleotidyltransferase family protein [Puia sp.]